jgi:hypothetical protein
MDFENDIMNIKRNGRTREIPIKYMEREDYDSEEEYEEENLRQVRF